MDVGIYLGHETVKDPSGLRDLAVTADELGYHSLWASEHVVVPVELQNRYVYTSSGAPEFKRDQSFSSCLVTLAHVAAVTTRVRLATCVIPMIAHHPLALAKEAAVVDRLSGGRLELGIGAGWLLQEAELQGLPHDRPGARMNEAVRYMRGAWGAEGAFSFDGEFWQVPDVFVKPTPQQGADLPIWIGGSGPARLGLVTSAGLHGVILASREHDRISEVRDTLGPDHRVALLVNIDSDVQPSELAQSLADFEARGADLCVLSFDVYDDRDAGRIARAVESLAAAVL